MTARRGEIMRSNWFCPQNPPPFRLAWSVVVCLTIGLNACGCQKIESNRVCLVSSLPRTGVSRQVSDEVVRGIRLAIDEVKEKAGKKPRLLQWSAPPRPPHRHPTCPRRGPRPSCARSGSRKTARRGIRGARHACGADGARRASRACVTRCDR